MTGFAHDPYDAEWEDVNTGRTVFTSSDDLELDDDCDVCRTTVAAGTCSSGPRSARRQRRRS